MYVVPEDASLLKRRPGPFPPVLGDQRLRHHQGEQCLSVHARNEQREQSFGVAVWRDHASGRFGSHEWRNRKTRSQDERHSCNLLYIYIKVHGLNCCCFRWLPSCSWSVWCLVCRFGFCTLIEIRTRRVDRCSLGYFILFNWFMLCYVKLLLGFSIVRVSGIGGEVKLVTQQLQYTCDNCFNQE